MSQLATRLRTYRALGWGNLARVAAYRARIRTRRFPSDSTEPGPFSKNYFYASLLAALPLQASSNFEEKGLLFGYIPIDVSAGPPDFLADPIDGHMFPEPSRPWFEIGDFEEFGDIKRIWELSRLGWVIPMAQRVRNGVPGALERLNSWIDAWRQNNPAWRGPNWKCGQEASIRVMHLAMAVLILGQQRSVSRELLTLVRQHLERIAPTIGYARAQDNNHGTSEAVALFIGGTMLEANGDPTGRSWSDRGRRAIEERVAYLVSADGSFSQHSMTYHRMLLDTLVMAESWRRSLGLPQFSCTLRKRAIAAAHWLQTMIFTHNGDGPNLGANDGVFLLALCDADYRDFRPTTQRAFALFENACAFSPGTCPAGAAWLSISLEGPVASMPIKGQLFDDGGYAVLRDARAALLLRYARFRFRPSHADVLHLDFWLDGIAILRDGGTYSYNAGDEWIAYFAGPEAHNAAQFDDAEQMPRLGRFLLGDWLDSGAVSSIDDTSQCSAFEAGYRTRGGHRHRRKIILSRGSLVIQDDLDGFERQAVLRWRLMPGDWTLAANVAQHATVSISVTGENVETNIGVGSESRRYLELTEIPVLSVRTDRPGRVITTITWAS